MKKRRKKMTKDRDIKILIVLVSVFVIISLLVLSFQIKNKSDNLTASYNARKEDLQLKQTGLEKAILDLNELAALKNQTPPKPTGGSSNPPAPTPTPPPVTRAS
jgi:predicted PurR-regulated permease PerM